MAEWHCRVFFTFDARTVSRDSPRFGKIVVLRRSVYVIVLTHLGVRPS